MIDFSPTFLRTVVDTLLPGLLAADGVPAVPPASAVGVDQRLQQHLTAHPEKDTLARALKALVRQAGAEAALVAADEETAVAALQQVERAEADAFAALLFIVAADYYEHPLILRAFGWRETPPQPEGYPLPAFAEALLEPVKSRQALWRPTTESP